MNEFLAMILGIGFAVFCFYGLFNLYELFSNKEKENNNDNIDNKNKFNVFKIISMIFTGSMLFVGIYVIFSSDTHPVIDRIVNEQLSKFSNMSYYDCLKKDVKSHIRQNLNLTQREIDALNFNGRANAELIAIRLDIISRVNSILTERFANSHCIPNWK